MARPAFRLAASASLLALAVPAAADNLREALAEAYNTNPTLQSARANQRATDEGVAIQRAAGLRPVGWRLKISCWRHRRTWRTVTHTRHWPERGVVPRTRAVFPREKS